jgi:long-subunit fatty acid transport protein
VADALLTEEIQPRAMTINDGVLVALRGINKNPGAENPWVYLLFLALLCLATGNSMAAGFYITEIGTPGSLGTAGAANSTNTYHADSAWTNPAGMTGLDEDYIVAGLQVVAPRVEFDPSVAEAGGKDGGNAGHALPIPSLFYVKKLSDRSRFGFSIIAPQGGGNANIDTEIDRHWEDTRYARVGFAHDTGEQSAYALGVSYDSSPVNDNHRTFDLPVDAYYKVSVTYGSNGKNKPNYARGATLLIVGEAEIDQTSQGVRAAGDFDTNYILFVGGSVRYAL